MKLRTLGKTGLKVSEIGFGCWEMDKLKWNTEEKSILESMETAVKFGVNFFDTAFAYGMGYSENLVGEFAKKNKIIIATKVPPKDHKWPTEDKNIQNVFPKNHIIQFAMKSFKNLGERKIDLLQLHSWLDEYTDENCWMEAFDELKSQGIAEHFGVSIKSHMPESALRLADSGKVETIQVAYNIFNQSPEDELFEICIRKNIGIIARLPFDEGSLTGKFTMETKFADWRKKYFTPEHLKETIEKVEKLRWLENKNRTIAQAALQFCLHHPAVSTVIPGSTNPKHAEENALASDGRLSEEELEKIKSYRWIRNFHVR